MHREEISLRWPGLLAVLFLTVTVTTFFPAVLEAAPPTLEVPALVKGEPGAFVRVAARTEGKVVRWIPLDPGLSVFPSDLLRDSKQTVVVGARAGRYRLLAITCLGDELSDPVVCTVLLGDTPPVPPGPSPDPAPPTDPLAKELQALFRADTGAGKAQHLVALTALYRQAPAALDKAATAGDLLRILRDASTSLLPPDALKPLRQRLAQELGANLPSKPDTPLDLTSKTKARELFTRIASALVEAGKP